MGAFAWTEEAEQIASDLWPHETASFIASLLGCTRNAVIGKMRRLGCEKPKRPAEPTSQPPREHAPTKKEMHQGQKRHGDSHRVLSKAMIVADHAATGAATPPIVRERGAIPQCVRPFGTEVFPPLLLGPNPKNRPADAGGRFAQAEAATSAPPVGAFDIEVREIGADEIEVEVEAIAAPPSGPVTFADLRSRHCRWVLDRVDGFDTLFCGEATVWTRAWCAYHLGVVYPSLADRHG